MEFPILDKTGLSGFLSEWGRQIFMPQGIFYWSGRAKAEADINATIGSAMAHMNDLVGGDDETKVVSFIPSMRDFFSGLSPNNVFSYAPVLGTPTFRKAWKDWIVYKGGDLSKGRENLITLPMTTAGVTGGLYCMTRLTVDPGEALVCPDKRWGNYDSIVGLNCGLAFHSFTLFRDGKFNTQGMSEALHHVWKTQAKATLILNFPNNPTGYTPSHKEVAEIRAALVDAVRQSGKKLTILFDDAYEGYVYDDEGIQRSMFYDTLNAHPNILSVKLDGVTKELLFYGGRLGLVTFGLHESSMEGVDLAAFQKELDTKFAGIIRTTVSNCCNVTQSVTEKVLQDKGKLLAERKMTVDLLTERVGLLMEGIKAYDPADITVDPCNGGFFAFMNVHGASGTKVAERLMTHYRVGVVPTEKGDINGIRVAFCGVMAEEMKTLCEAIPKAVQDVKKGIA